MTIVNSGIYKITNLENNKVYIGSSINIGRRIRQHISALKRGVHKSIKLQNSYNKHGHDLFKFEPLLICKNDDLIMYEQSAINAFDSANSGYNIAPIAGNSIGIKRSNATKSKLRLIATNQWLDQDYREKVVEGHCKFWTPEKRSAQALRASQQGRNNDTNLRISESAKARFSVQENLDKQREILNLIRSNPEIQARRKESISAALKSDEYRKKKSDAMKIMWEKRRSGELPLPRYGK